MFERLPNDPVMLLSVVNTKLRDYYPNLEKLCKDMDASAEEIKRKLENMDYHYDEEQNQFL